MSGKRNLPGGPVVKTLPSNAAGVGSIPGPRTKVPHAMGHNQKKKQQHNSCGGWGVWEEGTVREFGIDMYTLLYLKWTTNRDLPHSTGNSAQCFVAAWMGELGREWIYVYAWLSPFAVCYHNTVNWPYSNKK